MNPLFAAFAVGLALHVPSFGEDKSSDADGSSADVVVYGATPGGVCAAIAAAREGASVVLLEPTDHVGGVNTGGLCFSDSNQTVRSTVRGLFEEWHLRIEQDYQSRGVALPYAVAVKDHARWTYEPHVAARVTRQMLDEAGVRVLTERALTSVVKSGPRIERLATTRGEFAGRVFIDATYEGDLLAAAGASWTIGREGREAFGESYAGKRYPKPPMPFSGFDAAGGLLPLITTADAGPEVEGDAYVMVYSFRLCLTKDPDNRVPFPAPAQYDPARFEAVRRYLAQEQQTRLLWDLYPLPGGKFDANNGIGRQFSMGLVGGGRGWCEADAAGRREIWEAHREYTLELYRFLTTDPSVPEPLRRSLGEYGLCRDEFVDRGHWSPQLYVREGRRLQGEYVVSQKDILEAPRHEDPIVVSSFPIDSHDVQRVARPDGTVVNEGTIFPVRMAGRPHGHPYHVPYRAVVPRRRECDNLLVPVALSCTHVALASIRVEPTWMLLGQSAGIAAALSARKDVAVQDLDYPALRDRLLAQGQVLDLPALPPLPAVSAAGVDPRSLPGIVLDDSAAELQGTWSTSTRFTPFIGRGYRHDDRRGDGQSAATFRFTAPESGRYELRMAYSPHPTRAAAVPVLVFSGSSRKELHVDQTLALPPGQRFRPVGVVELTSGVESTISVRNAGTDGFVILDALQLVAVESAETN